MNYLNHIDSVQHEHARKVLHFCCTGILVFVRTEFGFQAPSGCLLHRFYVGSNFCSLHMSILCNQTDFRMLLSSSYCSLLTVILMQLVEGSSPAGATSGIYLTAQVHHVLQTSSAIVFHVTLKANPRVLVLCRSINKN